MTHLDDEHQAVNDGGLVIQVIGLATQRSVTDLTCTTSLWSPRGSGRISYDRWGRRVPKDVNLWDAILSAIAKTDWARRSYREDLG